jgi:hypothetical protein
MNILLCILAMRGFRLFLFVWRLVTAVGTVHALPLISGFKSPVVMALEAGFKLGGNGNYSINNVTLALLVPAEQMHALGTDDRTRNIRGPQF